MIYLALSADGQFSAQTLAIQFVSAKRQPLGPQNQTRRRIPSSQSQPHLALHAHLLFLAQSGRNWFSKIQRDLIARGIFTSKHDLSRKIMRYIGHHNKTARPFKWTYRNPSHRI
jgi:hypothetical protein